MIKILQQVDAPDEGGGIEQIRALRKFTDGSTP